MDYLKNLNDKQKEAVLHKEGPLLIVAGAGTGKTKTVTHRIIHLIASGVSPENILAITFTNKAAKEMLERVAALSQSIPSIDTIPAVRRFGRENDPAPFIGTFHSLGALILRENAELAHIKRHFSIIDKQDARSIIKNILKEKSIDPKEIPPDKVLWVISKQKGKLVTANVYGQTFGDRYPARTIADLWQAYEGELSRQNALDFDDLIMRPTLLLQKNPEVLARYRTRWTHIHIDEYQDTNTSQYELVKLLVGKRGNVCAVGDSDQCIYGWRGADFTNMLNFEKDYPGTKTVLLEQNYRSTQTILAVANGIIKKNKTRKEKNLFTKNIEGDKISLYCAIDEADEARFIAQKAKTLISEYNIPPEHIAVLYRANFQSRILEEKMLAEAVPYQVLGVKFFDRKEVKDVLAFIKAGLNPNDLGSIKRIINVPARGIGKVTLAKIFAGETHTLTPAMKTRVEQFYATLNDISEKAATLRAGELVTYTIHRTGIERMFTEDKTEDGTERLQNIRELVTLAKKYDALPPRESIEALLEDAALATDQDTLETHKNAVKLLTVHAAKGLEFPYVFVAGLEDGLFPYEKDGENKEREKEEERRLFYVGITRAKQKIFLSYASTRTIFGSKQVNVPSEFLIDIDDVFIEEERRDGVLKTIYF